MINCICHARSHIVHALNVSFLLIFKEHLLSEHEKFVVHGVTHRLNNLLRDHSDKVALIDFKSLDGGLTYCGINLRQISVE